MPDQPEALLVVEVGVHDMSVIPLDKQAHCLGKPPAADIPIDNPFVSRRHAQIVFEKGTFQIRDLGSKNGTFINGSRLGNEGLLLHSGDRIELGQGQVVLRFQEWSTTITLPSIG